MRAITISQPFASLIADGLKIVENRPKMWGYRGPLVIHAGKGQQYLSREQLEVYATGAAIAVGDLVNCFDRAYIRTNAARQPDRLAPGCPYTWAQLDQHEHTEGPCCLVIANVRKLRRPVPWRGALGLFSIPDELIEAEL